MRNIRVIDAMKDERIQCYSIMLSMDVNTYIELIDKAYKNNGGIEGQRIPLTNKSAIRIRDNMKKDILEGTILPPLVIGCTLNENDMKLTKDIFDSYNCNDINNESVMKIVNDILAQNELSIIDGMQRTTALKEILDNNLLENYKLRIELWVTNKANNLIYRMLVLNTGQISWGLKKQLEVVFIHIKKELQNKIDGIELIESNDGTRSNRPMKYQVSHFVELYLSFSTRKCDVNLSEKVTEGFAKQDIIEESYNQQHLDYFIDIVDKLVKLDTLLNKENGLDRRLFGDQNARIGFIVSMATYIFGRPSKKYDAERVFEKFNYINTNLDRFIEKIKYMSEAEIVEFCQFDWLKECTENLVKKELPEYYKKAFDILIDEDFDVENMNECWYH